MSKKPLCKFLNGSEADIGKVPKKKPFSFPAGLKSVKVLNLNNE